MLVSQLSTNVPSKSEGDLKADGSVAYTGSQSHAGYDVTEVGQLNFADFSELTISSGLVTITDTCHSIDTESDGASDDLDTISGGSNGDLLLLIAENAARVVTLKHGTGNIVVADGGDYILPANAVVLLVFDGTNWRLLPTGTFLANVVEDTSPQLGGDLDAQENDITNLQSLQFHTTPASIPTAEGSVYWDSVNQCVAVQNAETEATLQVGQENWIRVYNNSGGVISNGEVVYATGKEDTENRLTVGLAKADAANTSKVLGFATHDIEDSSFGYITQFGYINDIDTSAFTDGEVVWLSADTAGAMTNVEPQSPAFSVFLGFIVDSDASTGNLFITTLGNTSGTTIAGDATQVVLPARKGSAGTINKGQAVYVSGYNSGQNSAEVELADASSSGTMPAIGIASDSITNSATGNVTLSGRVSGFDTSSFSVAAELYISETTGALTATKPQGTALVQKVAIVLRSHATLGAVWVVGAGRSNDLPNLAEGSVWVGDANGVPSELNALTSATGTLKHEYGGLEFDASTVAIGDIVAGTGAGTMALVTATGHARHSKLTIQNSGAVDWEAPTAYEETDGATVTFNIGNGLDQYVVLDGNRTLALNTAAINAMPNGTKFTIKLTQDGTTGSRTVTWFSGISWAGGSAPTLTTTAGKSDRFIFVKTGTGAYEGYVVGQNI